MRERVFFRTYEKWKQLATPIGESMLSLLTPVQI